MHRAAGLARDLYFGFDRETLYLRLDFADATAPREALGLRLEASADHAVMVRIASLARGRQPVERSAGEAIAGASCIVGSIVELGVPFAALGLDPGHDAELGIHLLERGESIEPLPDGEAIRFVVPDARWESSMWSV